MELCNELLEQALAYGYQFIKNGKVATYIPELGNADANALGICIKTLDGACYKAGATDIRFTIQSISKIITLIAALHYCGVDEVFSKVGMEPSGESFNSLVELDAKRDLPYNPMINSGALTTTSLLVPYVAFEDMLDFARKICMDPNIKLNNNVYQSEMDESSRNKAIAYLLKSKGIIEHGVERSLILYTKMCSLNITTESLANFALLLANDGCNPQTGERYIESEIVRIVKTIMVTCGMYDGSGEFAVKVGLPTKSGVGGGLMSVVNKQLGIGIYGPALDDKGNSIAGCETLKWLSHELNLHLFT